MAGRRSGRRIRAGGKRVPAMAAALAVAAALAALFLSRPQGPGPAAAPLTIPQGPVYGAGQDYGSMVLRSVDGEEIPLKGRPTILLFVATWCGTCAAASVNVRSALGLSGAGAQVQVVVVGVWTSALIEQLGLGGRPGVPEPDSPERLRAFLGVYGDPGWRIVIDSDSSLARAFGLRYVDALIILDRQGREVYRAEPAGYAPPGAIASKIVEAVKGGGPA